MRKGDEYMSLQSTNLLRNIASATEKEQQTTILAKVTEIDGDNVYLTYYGETTQSQKPVKRLSSYSAAVNDVVMVQIINGSYLIVGKVV